MGFAGRPVSALYRGEKAFSNTYHCTILARKIKRIFLI
jgi:hypothetical protein